MRIRLLDFATEANALRNLRKRVLYPGLPETKAFYPGDETAAHIGAFDDSGTLVGIASLFTKEDGTIQLRGMATDEAVRGTGTGGDIVRFAEDYARKNGATGLWCNARLRAVGFYERCGWQTEGEEFHIPDVGPHFIMVSPQEFAI